jgi:hypothetical protein
VIKVIQPFLEFLRSFDAGQIHNRMAIMLDPCFKALHLEENLVGRGDVIRSASEYDVKVVVPPLMVCFDKLNPIVNTSVVVVFDVVGPKLEENIFGVGASIGKSS